MIYSKLAKWPAILARSRALLPRHRPMSSVAPTFSSSGDTGDIVARLGPARVATMIMTGKPNRPLPDSFNVDLEEFMPAAISAASVVTAAMAEGDWDSLSGLVEEECASEMRRVMAQLSLEERQLSVLNSEDVFFSFVCNEHKCDSGNDLHLVVFSLPKLGYIKSIVKENQEIKQKIGEEIKQTVVNFKEREKEGDKGDKEALKEHIRK